MNILITGGTGFIGSNLILELKNKNIKNNIAVISRKKKISKNITYIFGDIKKINKIKKSIIDFNPDVIVHLAWEGIPDLKYNKSILNLNNSINFFEQILNHISCKKIIVTGSCLEYGTTKGKCIESQKITTDNFFSFAKISLYNYLKFKQQENKFELIWFRVFYVYGNGQRKNSIIPYIFDCIKTKKNLKITNLQNKNDYVNVKDVVNVIKFAIFKKVKSGIYNLGYGKSVSVEYILKYIESLCKVKLKYKIKKAIKHSNFYSSNIKLFKNFKKFKLIKIEHGIKMYYEDLINK